MAEKNSSIRSIISFKETDVSHESIAIASTTTISVTALKDGNRAWFVCISAFILQICILGILHAYGVFFLAFLDDFKCSKASAAWVGSACYGATMAMAPLASLVIKRFGHRVSASIGCLICCVSMILSSYMADINSLYGSFTLLFAIGCSLAYTPCMTITTDYFHKYASQATGIIVAGSSTGTLIYSPMSQALVTAYGWRVTFRCLAAGCFIGFLCALQFKPLVSNKRTPSQRIKQSIARKDMNELQLWKNKVYMIWILAIFCVMFGYYIPYVHLISHAVEIGISPQLGSVLIMTLGGTCALGRILWGKILEKGYLDRLRMDQMSMVITGTFVMLLPVFNSFAGLLLYVIVIGLLDGCYVVLLPTLTEAFTGNEKKLIGWGFLNLVCSVSFTMGPVTAGWIYDATGSYDVSFHVAGIPIVLGAVILFFIPWAQKTAQSTNAMTAARQSYPHMSGTDIYNTDAQYIEMSNAISIPRSQRASYEGSFNPNENKGSYVVVDLANEVVQAYSTSQAGHHHIPITDNEKLPDALAKAMHVLQKKGSSILGQSYTGTSTDRTGVSFSITPRMISSQRGLQGGVCDTASYGIGSNGISASSMQRSLHSHVRNATSDLDTPRKYNEADMFRTVKRTASKSSQTSTNLSNCATSPPQDISSIQSLQDNKVTSPVGSPPQDSEMYTSVFQQMCSNPSLPPIAELPSTINAVVNTDQGASNNIVKNVEDGLNSSPGAHSRSSDHGSHQGSPTENHAMFQMTDLGELSLSNFDLTEDNVDGDK